MAVRNVAAIILAGGQGERLSVLSAQRAKPAVPFAGKYRIIDFTLSNCVNSGIYRVAVLTQYRPHSLNDHIGIGRPWDLDRMRGGVRMLQPYLGRKGSDWYKGTADAVYQNLSALADWRSDTLLILSGDHVYKQDYNAMLAFHEERKADCTVAVLQVPMEEAHRFGTLVTGDNGRVVGFDEKPPVPKSNLISMGIYVFDRDILIRRLEEDARTTGSKRDFGRDVVPRMVEMDRVFAYPFRGYWRDVGTIQSYWETNMGLLNEPPDFDLYDTDWIIHTRSEERPPARVTDHGRILCSLISHGSIINGTVEHSVLSPGVFVAEGAVVRDSILFPDCIVGPGSVVDRAILDKNVVVGAEVHLGEGTDMRHNRTQPRNLQSGITVVGKGARIPTGMRIGRNCLISADVIERDFTRFLSTNGHVESELRSGETVEAAPRTDLVDWRRRVNETLERVMRAALAAVEPAQAVRRALAGRDDFSGVRRVIVVGAGKASAPMAAAVEETVGDRAPIEGSVTVRYGHTAPTRHVRIREAGHPVPDAAGIEATQAIASLLEALHEDDLVVCVISGGGSALLTLPADDVSLEDLQATTNLLLRSGATINEINVVRKHLDAVKGGGLARLAQPARLLTLVLSDVVGNPLDAIASGPTVPDTSTFADAASVFERYELWDQAPASVAARIRAGLAGEVPETPKPGDTIFARSETLVVGSNLLACEAAASAANDLGMRSQVLTTYVEGEAREAGRVLAGLLREVDASGHPLARPCLLVAGGETTVTVHGSGSGGRNQELALAAAFALRNVPDVLLASVGTDGNDGPTDATGAFVDGTTLARAAEMRLDAQRFLANNDSYAFFDALGDLIRTGPTNTNVNDVYLLFAF